MASLQGRYLGAKKETTWGTAVVVDRMWPVMDVSPEGGPEHIDGEGMYAGELYPQVEEAVLGDETYKIKTQMQMYDHSQGLLFEAMLGAASSTGSGPYTREFTSADPLPSYTLQEVLIDATGTPRARTWAGCVVESWEIKIEAGKIVQVAINWSAKSMVTNIAAAVNAIPATLVPVHASRHLALTAYGSSLAAKSLTLSGDNKLTYDDRRFIGSTQIGARQVSSEAREVTGDAMLEFADAFTWWGRVVAGTFGAFQAVVTVGANTVTFDAPKIKTLGEMPKQPRTGIAEQPVKFKVHGQVSAGVVPLKITTVNSDVAA
jgi:hypothetical protein